MESAERARERRGRLHSGGPSPVHHHLGHAPLGLCGQGPQAALTNLVGQTMRLREGATQRGQSIVQQQGEAERRRG